MVTTALKTLQIRKWFENKSANNYKRSVIMYTVSMWFLFFDQLVLCYLFYIFSAPISGIIELHEGNFSVSSVAHSVDSSVKVATGSTRRSQSHKLSDASPVDSADGSLQQFVDNDNNEGEEFQKFLSNMWGERESYFR